MSEIISLLQNDPTALLADLDNSVKVLELVKSYFDPITKGNSILDEIYVEGLDASQVWPQSKIILDNVVENLMFEKIPSLKTGTDDEIESELEEELSQSDNDEKDEDQQEQIEQDEEDSEDDFTTDQGNLIDDYEDSDVEGEGKVEGDDGEIESQQEEKDDDDDDNDGGEEQQKDLFGLNDNFFSIDEFNKQTLQQDNDDFEDDGEKIDFNADIPSSEDEHEEVLYFNDFFEKPQSSKTKYNEKSKPYKSKKPQTNEEAEEEEEDKQRFNEKDFDEGMNTAMLDLYDDDEEEELKPKPENLSSFEKQQLQIQKEIAQLEKESIAEKRWTMKGESKAKDRPEDSLLAEDLEFERTAKPVPVITKEVTESLEEMIRRRIKEGNFDDIPRRIISDITNFKPSSTFELSQAKSSKSLAELYEDDFKGEDPNSAVSEELQKSHDEIKSMFQSISYKLDALSSAHFIPKPAEKSIDIKVNTAAISMEDAQPLTLSSASTLAPQEIYRASRSADSKEITLKSGVVLSREELSREDKHRLRRANKRKRSKEFKQKEASGTYKKSKKQDVIDTLSKAGNVTIIGSKGEKTDVQGALKVDKAKQGTSSFKL